MYDDYQCWYFSSDLWPSSGEVRIPVGKEIGYTVRWDPEKNEDIHAMVEIPIPSLVFMCNRIRDLVRERNQLRDTLESARMG